MTARKKNAHAHQEKNDMIIANEYTFANIPVIFAPSNFANLSWHSSVLSLDFTSESFNIDLQTAMIHH